MRTVEPDEAAQGLLASAAAQDVDPERLSAEQSDCETISNVTTEHGDSLSDHEHGQVRRLLYISHFLSTWNSRVFEFGAFLFLAKIYPQTLLPASVYALARNAAAAIASPWLGPYIDRANRLHAVRVSIGKCSSLLLPLNTSIE